MLTLVCHYVVLSDLHWCCRWYCRAAAKTGRNYMRLVYEWGLRSAIEVPVRILSTFVWKMEGAYFLFIDLIYVHMSDHP